MLLPVRADLWQARMISAMRCPSCPVTIGCVLFINKGIIADLFLVVVNEFWNFMQILANVPKIDWRARKASGGHSIRSGVHLMAMINVLGGKVRSVHSNCLNVAKVYDRQFDDTSTTLLKFENAMS
jgi:predicted dehydrogenase